MHPSGGIEREYLVRVRGRPPPAATRQLRAGVQAVGFGVSRLRRIRYGPIDLPRDLRPGSVWRAGPAALGQLRDALPEGGRGRGDRP